MLKSFAVKDTEISCWINPEGFDQKRLDSIKKKYGTDHAMQNKDVRAKQKQTRHTMFVDMTKIKTYNEEKL